MKARSARLTGFSIYPEVFWLGLALLIGLLSVCTFLFESMAPLIMLVIIAGAAPVLRHSYLFPLAQSRRYADWLRTVPFHGEKALPNGSLYPGWADAVIWISLTLPILTSGLDGYSKQFLLLCVLGLPILIFGLIYAVCALKLGPAWVGYVIVSVTIVLIRLIFWGLDYAYTPKNRIWVAVLCAVGILLAAIVTMACYAIRQIIASYPWDRNGPVPAGIGRLSFTEFFYAQGNVRELGTPIVLLDPKGSWPEVKLVHQVGIGALAGLLCLCLCTIDPGPNVFLFFAVPTLVLRYVSYFMNRKFFVRANWGRLVEDVKAGTTGTNAVFGLLVLAVMVFGITAILAVLPIWLEAALSPFLVLACWVAAFRLPPSRRTWETSGKWSLKLRPPEPLSNTNPRARQKASR